MPITVSTNVLSINAQRNLGKSATGLQKSLERLSSGLRINRAGDDAAGLAISEGLRSQIRGLGQAVRNANDGLSLLATAEGATDEATNILQRIRELSVQAASDTNSASNRSALNEEAQALISELDRIASSVEFNGIKLLDGSFSAKKIHVGAFADQNLKIELSSLRTSTLGQVAEATGGAVTDAIASGDVTINGVDVGASSADGVSFASSDGSAIAIANAINSVSGETNVTAKAGAAVASATDADVAAITVDGDASAGTAILINGVNIGAVSVTASDSDGALRDSINAVSNQTGVTASIESNRLVLTASDGRNISLETIGDDGAGLTVGEALGFEAVDASDDNVNAVVGRGTITLTSDKTIVVGGADAAASGHSAGPIAIDATTAINSTNVSTQAGANTAITRVDNALRQLSSNRASIGALSNRLESTITSLQSISENLSASDSRIRDADFAAETATLTKNQILQQAGVAILAQANQVPQLALSLLG